jgi:hypothetical protein
MRLSTLLLGILSLLVLAGWAWDYQTREQARLRLRVIAAQLEPWGQLRYQNLRAHPWGQGSVEQLGFTLSPSAARQLSLPAGTELRIDRLEISRYREDSGQTPERLLARWSGLHWPLPHRITTGTEITDPAEQPLPSLGELGYPEWRFDGELGLRYLPAEHSLQLRFSLSEPSALALAGHLSLRSGAEIFRGETAALELGQLQLEYRDLGLLSRLKTLLALRARVSASALEQALVARLERETQQRALHWNENDYRALDSFLREPQALLLRLDPPGKLQLRDLSLYAESDLPQVLGLELRAPNATTPTVAAP